MVKPKDCHLPALIKMQDLNALSPKLKRHNFEPFKLRAMNNQEKKSESSQERPPSPLRSDK
jgi:hypothetical protein